MKYIKNRQIFESNVDIEPVVNWINSYFTKEKMEEIKSNLFLTKDDFSLNSINDSQPSILIDSIYEAVLDEIFEHFSGLTNSQRNSIIDWVTNTDNFKVIYSN